MESCNRIQINDHLLFGMSKVEKKEAFRDFLIETDPSRLEFQPSKLYSKYIKEIQSIKSLLSDVQTKKRDKNSRKTEPQEATQYKNIIRLYRKTMSLPDDSFDQDVIITSRDGNTFFSSKELLSLFSEYFERILNSNCKEGQKNESGHHEITLDLSDSSLCTLLNYFSSKKVMTKDVETLLEVFGFANMILKESLQRDILKELIPHLIKEENRDYFSRELFSGAWKDMELDFVWQYLDHRGIKTQRCRGCAEDKLSITIGDFMKLFNRESPVEDVLSEYITGIVIGKENYTTIPFYPQQYLDNITNMEYDRNYERNHEAYRIESDCKKIITSFRKLRGIFINSGWDANSGWEALKKVCAGDKKAPFTNAILGYAENSGASVALEYLKKAASQIPQNQFNTRFGRLYCGMSDFENAEKFFKKALEDAPNCAFTNAELAISYLNQDNFILAEQYLIKASEIDPKETSAIRGWELWKLKIAFA